jgi:hypothetical protein
MFILAPENDRKMKRDGHIFHPLVMLGLYTGVKDAADCADLVCKRRRMKKQYTALLAALLITMCVAATMLLVGGSALLNKHGLPVADSPAQVTATAQAQTAEQAQIQQLQGLVAQYQARETQYQQELDTAGQNLERANAQLQQYQILLMALRNRGLIAINEDGSVSIAR